MLVLRVAPEPPTFSMHLRYPPHRSLLEVVRRSFQTFDAM
jgi:hypothetical protein